MKIYSETNVQYFGFWSGAKDTAKKIDEAGAWDTIEYVLDELYPDGIDETELNDLFWFEPETVLEWAGIEEEEEEEEEEI